jgi:hypothetical protein
MEKILKILTPLMILVSCSEGSKSEEYPFPPEGADFSFVMHRIDPINGDTMSSRALTSFMFDDGLFLDSDKSYFDVESMTEVRDTSASSIEIFISNEFGNRVLEITESYIYSDNGEIEYIIDSQTEAKYQFKGTKIYFPIVFDGVPCDFLMDCTASKEDITEWFEIKIR